MKRAKDDNVSEVSVVNIKIDGQIKKPDSQTKPKAKYGPIGIMVDIDEIDHYAP